MIAALRVRLDALEAHRARFCATVDALPEPVQHAVPAPGAWSLAQLGEHLLRIDRGLVLGGPASFPARATSRLRAGALRGVLALPLRIPAPPGAGAILPSAGARWPGVREAWAELRASWPAAFEPLAAADLGRVAFRHPLAGPFCVADALDFLHTHHRHHDAQVRRTLAALGARGA